MKQIKISFIILIFMAAISGCKKKENATTPPSSINTFTLISRGCWAESGTINVTGISCGANGNNWMIYASYNYPSSGPSNLNVYGGIKIYLPGHSSPTSAGTYSLIPNDTLLTSGNACIDLQEESDATFCGGLSTSGQLQITIDNGKVHAVFNGVIAGTAYSIKYSGDIICS